MNIKAIKEIVEHDGIIFLTYGGFLSQTLILGMTEVLEKETLENDMSMGVSSNIFTIFIELAQNMMNYSKTKHETLQEKSEKIMIVGKDDFHNYYIHTLNIIDKNDKEKIESRLNDIEGLSKDEIKARYRELRKSGKHSHSKGGGIGFYEIAKRADLIKHKFSIINEDKYYFHLEVKVANSKDRG